MRDGRGFPWPGLHSWTRSRRAFQNSTEDAKGARRGCWPNATVVGSVVVELSSKRTRPAEAEESGTTNIFQEWMGPRSFYTIPQRWEDRLFGKYDHPAKFAVRTNLTGANATIGCKIGKGKRVSFLKDAVAAHDPLPG